MKNLLEVKTLTTFLSCFAVSRMKHCHCWETAMDHISAFLNSKQEAVGLELRWEKEKGAGLVWEKDKKRRRQQGTAKKGVPLNLLEWRSRAVTCLFTFLCHFTARTRQGSRQRQSQALRSHIFAWIAFLFTFPFTNGLCQTAAGIMSETTKVMWGWPRKGLPILQIRA